ncbi:Trafficking protein particle complex subunit BET5 [Lithohypha guttulata]|uniref:Trafficking protein particle complex subunit BET5 n=1 Tax=Lithohypha guttulata TaxID=1690604 RepID=UPI002DDDD00F|nr:Trafficking protein particle complex subunit BET5 [Lithohypha guttulata]
MVVFAFYVFDRHAECIYKRRWQDALPGASATSSRPPSQSTVANAPTPARQSLKSDDDAKLIFGTVYSLRNMVRKLGGEDDRHDFPYACSFLSYRTSQYKLHYYETPTNIKFVMLTDVKANSMRHALQQIYVNIYVEYVVKNALSPAEHPGGIGVDNELFEASLDVFVERVLNTQPPDPRA